MAKASLSKPVDRRKRAVVDDIATILANKGTEVWTIEADATVYDALAMMAHRSIGALPVLAEGRLVGIITERDYSRKVILQGRSSQNTSVRDIMTATLVTVGPDTTVDVCLRLMSRKRVRYLPVIAGGELAGIVSIGDLVGAIISAQAYTIEQLHGYITAG